METILQETLSKFHDIVKKPEKFLLPQDEAFESVKVLTKVLYDFAKLEEGEESKNSLSTLPELIIENFDEEQIWSGVDLQNQAKYGEFQSKIEDVQSLRDELNLLLGSKKRKRKVSEDEQSDEETVFKKPHLEVEDFADEGEEFVEEEEEEEGENVEEEESEGEEKSDNEKDEDDRDSILDDPDFAHMSDSDGDDLPLFDKDESDDDEEDKKEEESEEEESPIVNDKAAAQKEYEDKIASLLKQRDEGTYGKDRKTEVDDEFFKLADMEKFLESEDANEERRRLKEEKGIEDDDDEGAGIDMFDELDDDDNAMYQDYFDGEEKKKSLLDDSDEEKDLGEVKSSHEERQSRLKKKIKQMEDNAIAEKPWQMTGEVTGPARPENSLLEQDLDFESAMRKAPVITEAVSKRLEDIILQRVKDKAWDDVERKIKPVEDPYAIKKKLILDQEKSKLSLAQVYEEEYLKQKGELEEKSKMPGVLEEDEKDVKEVEDIRRDMKNLFAKLDTLTHFHYTPKPVNPEVKIIRNVPTIAMEEVAPVGTSDAALLAPEEIVDKKRGVPLESEEKTETDKKRERRKKKKLQHDKKVQREKKVEKVNPGMGNKYSKKKMMKDLEEAEKQGKNVKAIKDKGGAKAVKSSTAFFDQLQNEAQSAIKEKIGGQKKKKDRKELSAAKLKL